MAKIIWQEGNVKVCRAAAIPGFLPTTYAVWRGDQLLKLTDKRWAAIVWAETARDFEEGR